MKNTGQNAKQNFQNSAANVSILTLEARFALMCYTPTNALRIYGRTLDTGNVNAVLDGALDTFIEAYLKMKARQK